MVNVRKRNKKFVDLTGQKFGRWTVLKRSTDYVSPKGTISIRWSCECSCENKTIKDILGNTLKNGQSKSCGCLVKERASNLGKTTCKDLIGQKFGMLTVTNRSGSKNGRAMWDCSCLCGGNKAVCSHDLKSGNVISCGCMAGNPLPNGMGMINRIYDSYKINSLKRGLDFNIEKDVFLKLIVKNCFYCDAPPSNSQRNSRNSKQFLYTGIDRVDNSKGYFIDNVVPCCSTCNKSKLKMAQEDFLDWNKRVIIQQSKSWTNKKIEEFINQIREAGLSCNEKGK